MIVRCDSCAHKRYRDEWAKSGPYCAATLESPREGENYQDCKAWQSAYEAKLWKPKHP